MRYDFLNNLIDITKPQSICEIGVWRGMTAKKMCTTALRYNNNLTYEGYDLWEDLKHSEAAIQMANKGPSSKEMAIRQLSTIKDLNYKLISGDTEYTLPNKYFDFVFLDGDHRDFAIQRDYERIKDSETIVFDDYYSPKIDGVGCNDVKVSNKKIFLSLIGDSFGPHKFFPVRTEIKFVIATSNQNLLSYFMSNGFKEL